MTVTKVFSPTVGVSGETLDSRHYEWSVISHR